ncbi:MAG: hypothetical protein EB060_12530, partial [Proteobacteria bacterium]|nr:hypothetical protein [Pseudomonadota bacterium]
CDSRVLGKRQLEMLSKAGAFDPIHQNRKQIHDCATLLSRFNSKMQEEKASQQVSLFGGMAENKGTFRPALMEVPDWSNEERMAMEFEALGFYLTAHPLDSYREELERIGVATSANVEEKITGQSGEVRLAGVVTAISHRATGGKRFAYAQLSDPFGTLEISIFNEDLIAASRDLLEGKLPLLITADARKDEGGVKLIAARIRLLDQFLEDAHVDIRLNVKESGALPQLKSLLGQAGKGRGKIHLNVVTANGVKLELLLPDHYALKPATLTAIKALPGIEAA